MFDWLVYEDGEADAILEIGKQAISQITEFFNSKDKMIFICLLSVKLDKTRSDF